MVGPDIPQGGGVPVTAKLSRKFYDKLGDDVANELVDWFNQVDVTYRTELRDLNELNFARFDARLEQRFAESDAKWEHRLAESDVKWERRFAESDIKWEQRLADLRTELIRWLFVFWVGTTVTFLGTTLALLKL